MKIKTVFSDRKAGDSVSFIFVVALIWLQRYKFFVENDSCIPMVVVAFLPKKVLHS